MDKIWIEFKRFLIDYKKMIIGGAVVIALLFTGIFAFLGGDGEATESNESDLFPEEFFDDTKPAYFQAYLEYEDGVEFGNSSLVEEHFRLDDTKEEVKKETGVDIDAIQTDLGIEEEDEVQVVHVERDDSSYVWTFSFNTGKEADNLKLANYYHDLLFSEELAFLEDKMLYPFQAPKIAGEMEEAELAEEKAEEGSVLLSYLKYAVLGFFLGLLAMIFFLFLKVMSSKKLEYAFAYEANEEIPFLLSDPALKNNDLLHYFIALPADERKVLLAETGLSAENRKNLSEGKVLSFKKGEKETQLVEYSSFSEIDFNEAVSELILIVQPNQTSRTWYRKQLEFAEMRELDVKIIQMNA